MISRIPYRVGLQQRILPIYRGEFFSMLAEGCDGGLSVFAGEARDSESVTPVKSLKSVKLANARNIHLLHGKLYTCWQVNLMEWLAEWDPAVLIMEANPRYLHSPSAIRWMHNRHRPVIGWGLGTSGEVEPRSLEGLVWRKFLNSFDALIAYSQSGAQEYQGAGVPRESIYVAPNAVLAAPVHETYRPNTYTPEGPVVLYVGRLQARKNVDILIRACAQIQASPPIRLWIIGDGPERRALEALADEVTNGVRFFGVLHGEETREYFQKADLFVLPGTGGLAVQEAMSYGLPVIVGAADGTQSNLVTEANGWLLPDSTVDTLAQMIKSALDDVSELRRKGKQSYEIVKNDINLEAMVGIFSRAVQFAMERTVP